MSRGRATKRQHDGVQRGTQKTKPSPSLSFLFCKMGFKIPSSRKMVRISYTCLTMYVSPGTGSLDTTPLSPTHWLRPPVHPQPAPKHRQPKKNKPEAFPLSGLCTLLRLIHHLPAACISAHQEFLQREAE